MVSVLNTLYKVPVLELVYNKYQELNEKDALRNKKYKPVKTSLCINLNSIEIKNNDVYIDNQSMDKLIDSLQNIGKQNKMFWGKQGYTGSYNQYPLYEQLIIRDYDNNSPQLQWNFAYGAPVIVFSDECRLSLTKMWSSFKSKFFYC